MSNCSQNCWSDWNSALHRGMDVCPICEGSLSHHTLYMGNLVPAYTCITISVGQVGEVGGDGGRWGDEFKGGSVPPPPF